MKALTVRQQQVYEVIRDHINKAGMPPTRAEISIQLGFRSPNAAEEHLKALARKRVIEIISGASRGIRLMSEQANRLPLIRRFLSEKPLCAQNHIERHYKLDPNLFKPCADFLLRVSGMSMKNIGIMHGDLLVVHKTKNVINNQIVVVRINNEVSIKRLKRYSNNTKKIRLLPENSEYQPIIMDLHSQAVIIEGIVVGVIRNGNNF